MLEISRLNPSNASLPDAERRLLSRIAACRRRADELGRAVLLRLHATLPNIDPWELWGAQHGAAEAFYLWNDGRMGLCAAAWGTLRDYTAPAPRRFQAAREFCSRLLEDVVDVPFDVATPIDVDAPLAFGGFAFSDKPAAPQGPWAAWDGGRLYVPACLVYRRTSTESAHTVAVLHTSIESDCDPAAVYDALSRRLEELRTPSRRSPLRPEGGSSVSTRLLEEQPSWSARVTEAQRAAQEGALDKVVLARSAEFCAPAGYRFDVAATLRHLRQVQPRSICFAMRGADGSCFLGASPEILVQVMGRSLRTQAVAGTAPRGADEAEDAAIGAALVNSAKDRGEHAVVANVLRQALAPLCVELTEPEEPRLIRLPQVQHLETPFAGTLRQAGGILELVESLHPTPSVGGWPTDSALAWLDTHEPERGWYAGPVGWLTAAGDGVFAVAIRSVLVAEGVALAYTGAGIVAASNPAAEWRETELKLRTISDALKKSPRDAHQRDVRREEQSA